MSPPTNPHERHLAVSGILVPATTPFGEDGRIAPERLAENIARWEAVEVEGLALSGYAVLGSSGEAPLLTYDERRTLIRAAREAVPSHKRLLVGTGAESTARTIARCREASGLGADGVLVLTPSYYRTAMTEDALARFYLDVAETSPIPILLYNVPQFTGIAIGEAVVRHLKAHPNIVGIKDSSGDAAQVGEITYKAPHDFHVLVGNAPILLAALVMGASGGILAIANPAPSIPLRILAHVRAGRLDAARDLQLASLAFARAVPGRFGIAGLKAAMDMTGYYGGPPRPPLPRATAATRLVLHALLTALDLV